MPELGGKTLAGNVKAMLGDLRKKIDDAKINVASAVTELQSEIASADAVARQLRDEADAVREAFGEVLGNNPPEDAKTGE